MQCNYVDVCNSIVGITDPHWSLNIKGASQAATVPIDMIHWQLQLEYDHLFMLEHVQCQYGGTQFSGPVCKGSMNFRHVINLALS